MPVSLGGSFYTSSGALVFTSGSLVFVTAVQGSPLDCLALKARTPDCQPQGRLKHTSSLSEKEAYLLVRALRPKGQAPLLFSSLSKDLIIP